MYIYAYIYICIYIYIYICMYVCMYVCMYFSGILIGSGKKTFRNLLGDIYILWWGSVTEGDLVAE